MIADDRVKQMLAAGANQAVHFGKIPGIIRIRHIVFFPIRDKIKQPGDHRRRIRPGEPAQIAQIGGVHGDDVIKFLQVAAPDLPGADAE